MSLEDQIPDVESGESDNEVQQSQNTEDHEEDPNSLFNNLTSFQGIYTNNQIIDNEVRQKIRVHRLQFYGRLRITDL